MHRDSGSGKPPLLAPSTLYLPYLLLALASLFWASNAILGRAVHAEIPPIGFAFWRWACGSIVLVGLTGRQLRRDWPQLQRHWKVILLLAALSTSSFSALLYLGLQFTTAINGLLIQSMMPLGIVVLSYLLFRETLSLAQGLGVLISSVGAVAIVARGDWGILSTLSFNQGDVIILIATACYAAYSTLLRLRPPLPPLSFLTATSIVGALLLLPFYLWESWAVHPMSWNRVTLLAVVYVALFPSILSYFCFNQGVEQIGANRAGLFIHLIPVFGSIMAILFLHETPQWFHAVGFLLILVGIALVTGDRR